MSRDNALVAHLRRAARARWDKATPEQRAEAGRIRGAASPAVLAAAGKPRCACGRFTLEYATRYRRAEHRDGRCIPDGREALPSPARPS